MPSISKIRFTNVVYEDGMKRYNDEIFKFDGYNAAILLENGGGKTVFIHTALQAIIPHTNLSERKIKQTLQLDNYPAHIAIEWILSENPRRYLVTCVSLFLTKDGLGSYRYVYPYAAGDRHNIENIPFVKKDSNRPADRGEISDYYQQMAQQFMNALTFSTIKEYQEHIEEQYHIIANEWESIVKINSTEGGVEAFFDECKQTTQLFDRLLIPTVESAIAGHNQHTFAETFEKHRMSFKLYKELNEQIEEYKAIEEELNHYVLTYEDLHEQQKAYEQKKQFAKALMNLINKQDQEHKDTLEAIQLKMKNWEMEERHHVKKVLSLEIQNEQLKLDKVENELEEYASKYNLVKDDLVQAKNTFYSLKYAELKKTQKEQLDLVQSLTKQLEMFNQDEEIHDIQDRLEENSRELHGYFLYEQEESQKRLQGYKIEKQPIDENIEQLKMDLDRQKTELGQAKSMYENTKGKMETLDDQMSRIQKRILSNPEQESVKENGLQWEKRLVELDNEIVQLINDNKQLEGKISDLKKESELLYGEKEQEENTRIKLAVEIKQIDNAHDKVKEELGKLRTQWASIDSIYLKQDSLTEQIRDYIQQLNKEREVCLHKERLAHRLMDDYGTQDLFFADAYLEKQLKQWSNQFHLLETGIQFIQSLNDSISDSVKKYPLWAMTLITTEAEVELLKSKIIHISKDIQYPINVITIEQARAIVYGEVDEIQLLTPNHWVQNQDRTLYHQWKETMRERAEQSTQQRIEIEAKLTKWNQSAEKLSSFLQEYPYSEYQERKDYMHSLVHRIQQVMLKQNEIQTHLADYEEKLKKQVEKISAHKEEYNGLHSKVKDALEYIQLEKKLVDYKKIQEHFTSQIHEHERIIKKVEDQIERLVQACEELKNRVSNEEYHYQSLLINEFYVEVKHSQPKYTDKEKTTLLSERQELKYAERKLSSTRNEIVLKLDHAHKGLTSLSDNMENFLLDYGPIQEDTVFPPNGKDQISQYREKIKKLEKRVEEAGQQFQLWNEKKIKQKTAFEMAIRKFHDSFSNEEPVKFQATIVEVQEQLAVEKNSLKEQHDYLHREQNRISKEYTNINEAFHELDRYEEAHHFKGPSVEAITLSEEDIQTFTYGRLPFVQKVTAQLKEEKNKVTKELEKVNRAKERFKSFYKSKITNIKMREMARQGIENKRTYKEIVEFQTHMQKSIQTAIKYNEASIINHDKVLEQFVTRINDHLRTITGELELIPKKTRVKVEDNLKEIFKFSIPDWTEAEGKSRIRKHIEWILQQLNSDRYLNAEGKEDYAKVRKDIETWLNSKQLIRVVMNNEVMKVTCRKVTNDNQVTTRSYTWEQSNVWSGGEKWSKNMTLYLGILNYVAEKQKHIEANMKRHRVVILDNPFGKASSDHVLNPVFFIAEQLGFQIIALTAHGEGKFLRDYFPVIYSCRLRKAADSNKQVMTKVKQIHQAYFQDHEPLALERLGEVEQMELF